MMRTILFCLSCIIPPVLNTSLECRSEDPEQETSKISHELDKYWAKVSRSVKTGDFIGYSETCHSAGILVSGIKQTSYPLQQALQRWKSGFDDTRAGRMTASVEFRFSQRLHDPTTAHETGIFRYASTQDGKTEVQFIHFEGLLQKTPDGWKILMEHQKSMASESEWEKLAPSGDNPKLNSAK